MAYKSLGADLKLVRNLIQDNTTSPYAGDKDFPSSTKYVFSFTSKPASSTPTDAELFNKADAAKLPVIVTVSLIANPRDGFGGSIDLFGVMVRCFATVGTKATFKSNKLEAEELALEKLNEIVYELTNSNTIKAALSAQGLWLPDDGIGGIRPVDPGNRQDFGFAMELTFTRTNTV